MTTQIRKSHTRSYQQNNHQLTLTESIQNTEINEKSGIILDKLDPYSFEWIIQNGYYIPVPICPGENPTISKNRFMNAWNQALKEGHNPPSNSQLRDYWAESAIQTTKEVYKTENPKEWAAIEIAETKKNDS